MNVLVYIQAKPDLLYITFLQETYRTENRGKKSNFESSIYTATNQSAAQPNVVKENSADQRPVV
jgi:hypothetical protein